MSPGWSPDAREISCWLLKMAIGPMRAPDKKLKNLAEAFVTDAM